MEPVTGKRPLVRPRFRRWSIVIGTLLALLVMHTLWDYSEARQLQAAFHTWDPGWNQPPAARSTLAPTRDAAPYYLAAGALARHLEKQVRDIDNNVNALRKGDTTAATLNRVSRILDDEADVLHLLDRATELDFEGFDGRANVLSDLLATKRLATLRAMYAMATGDADAATRSLVTELKLDGSERSPMSSLSIETWPVSPWIHNTVDDIGVVLSRVEPSAGALERLAAALAGADEDARIARFFAHGRDRVVNNYLYQIGPYDGSFATSGILGEGFAKGRPNLFDRIFRPLVARDLRWKLQQYAAIVTAAQSPWPGRIDAVVAAAAPARTIRRALGFVAGPIYPGEIGYLDTDARGRNADAMQLRISATYTALVRAARVAVAVERYRRANQGHLPGALGALTPAYLDAVPVDPYSGGPLVFSPADDGYVVYSVGGNGKDDGGRELDEPLFARTPRGAEPRMTGDVGVRIRLK